MAFTFLVFRNDFCVAQRWSDGYVCWNDLSTAYRLQNEGKSKTLQNAMRTKGMAKTLEAISAATETKECDLTLRDTGRTWLHPALAMVIVESMFDSSVAHWFGSSFKGTDIEYTERLTRSQQARKERREADEIMRGMECGTIQVNDDGEIEDGYTQALRMAAVEKVEFFEGMSESDIEEWRSDVIGYTLFNDRNEDGLPNHEIIPYISAADVKRYKMDEFEMESEDARALFSTKA